MMFVPQWRRARERQKKNCCKSDSNLFLQVVQSPVFGGRVVNKDPHVVSGFECALQNSGGGMLSLFMPQLKSGIQVVSTSNGSS